MPRRPRATRPLPACAANGRAVTGKTVRRVRPAPNVKPARKAGLPPTPANPVPNAKRGPAATKGRLVMNDRPARIARVATTVDPVTEVAAVIAKTTTAWSASVRIRRRS